MSKRLGKVSARHRDVKRRKGVKHSKDDAPSGERRHGDELTHYQPRFNRHAESVARLSKFLDDRAIAKKLGISLREVRDVREALR